MELSLSNTLLTGDPRLVDHIVGEVKSQGIFDQFRKECIADVDTKPAYQNLHTRVEGSVNSFLDKQPWKPDLNKNQLRETLRKHIHEAPYLDAGVERIVDQVVNPKVYSVFMPQIEDVVYKFLGLEKPKTKEKSSACGFKDLLPKDLDPVSPESDKNSLKDVSLESVDTMDELDGKKDEKSDNLQTQQYIETYIEGNKDVNSEHDQTSGEEKTDELCKLLNKSNSNLNVNTSIKSDDKTEEDEEDSPTFEPIDIMNLNESNISNDSHLSGISELTSHRSRSPDFSNEVSRDNFDYSNQDSQLSKVSSDSRLSIVTDFGSSNHALTPVHEVLKEETVKEKCENKHSKDNFKAIREFESSKNRNSKNVFEFHKCKDTIHDSRDSKDLKTAKFTLSSKENSRDATDSSKDKYEHRNYKDKNKDSESSKSKSAKEKIHSRDSKYYKDKDSDKKKQSSHSSTKYDKHSKHKLKEKVEYTSKDQMKESVEKGKDMIENSKDNSSKYKDEKLKEIDKKEIINKEVKDLKDLYKEKIRELREKKELTEKEKLNKDNKDCKVNKESKERKDSSKEKKLYKKEHKSSSSKNSSISHHEVKTNKMSEKSSDVKDKKSDSKDKSKRDEKYLPKDNKSKSHFTGKPDTVDKFEKQEVKKSSKNERDEKYEKSEAKKDTKSTNEKTPSKKDQKNHLHNKAMDHSNKTDGKKDIKNDAQSKDKKRRDDKKSKTKDDHSSLRKNSNDRRSTDRDGSNGSNSKTSQCSNSSSHTASSKSGTSNLNKETSHVNNSSSETSDTIEETQVNELKLSPSFKQFEKTNTIDSLNTQNSSKCEMSNAETCSVQLDVGSIETNLPLKKRPLLSEDSIRPSEIKIKKPKFAKNIHEAKKLMKIRKQIEKQKVKENKKTEKRAQQKTEAVTLPNTISDTNDLKSVPDEERVQIIEIPDEEYEEPYPEKQTNLTLEERSIILLEGEPCTNDLLQKQFNLKSKLSNIELSIGQSIDETICNKMLTELSSMTENLQCNKSTADTQSQHKEDSEQSTENLQNLETFKDNESTFQLNEMEAVAPITNTKGEDIESLHSKKECVLQSMNTLNSDTISTTDNKEIQKISKIHEIAHDKSKFEKNGSTFELLESAQCSGKNDQDPNSEKVKHKCPPAVNVDCATFESTSTVFEDYNDCRYFRVDNEKSEKFCRFVETYELEENSTLEDIIESLGGQLVSSMPKEMAPPLPKRKHTSSPLADILLNNSNNNNDGHTKTVNLPNENALNNVKKRKLIGPKKQRFNANLCAPQGLLNGENFVMPLSPESDVSATSEKIPSSNSMKEEKSRHRSSQRYSSDDLYKPRPLFSTSSRRSRRSNQA